LDEKQRWASKQRPQSAPYLSGTYGYRALAGLLLLLLSCLQALGQAPRDTGNQVTITIRHADFLERATTDTASYVMKLVGNVALVQGSSQLFLRQRLPEPGEK